MTTPEKRDDVLTESDILNTSGKRVSRDDMLRSMRARLTERDREITRLRKELTEVRESPEWMLGFNSGFNEAVEQCSDIAEEYPSAAFNRKSTGEKIAEQIRALNPSPASPE